MKTTIHKTCARLFAFAGVAFVASSASAAPTKYPLVCRGGGDIRTIVGTDESGKPFVRLNFARSVVRGADGVGPGECAWRDRPVNATEPTCIVYPNTKATIAYNGSGIVVEASTPSTNSNVDVVLNWLREDWMFQTFNVYNPQNGDCLRE